MTRKFTVVEDALFGYARSGWYAVSVVYIVSYPVFAV